MIAPPDYNTPDSRNRSFHPEELAVATFIATLCFTEQGFANIHETCARAASFKNAAKKIGVKVVATYWTQGASDGVLILEADNEEAATAVLLHLGSQGNVRTQTTRAYNAAEMEKILTKVT